MPQSFRYDVAIPLSSSSENTPTTGSYQKATREFKAARKSSMQNPVRPAMRARQHIHIKKLERDYLKSYKDAMSFAPNSKGDALDFRKLSKKLPQLSEELVGKADALSLAIIKSFPGLNSVRSDTTKPSKSNPVDKMPLGKEAKAEELPDLLASLPPWAASLSPKAREELLLLDRRHWINSVYNKGQNEYVDRREIQNERSKQQAEETSRRELVATIEKRSFGSQDWNETQAHEGERDAFNRLGTEINSAQQQQTQFGSQLIAATQQIQQLYNQKWQMINGDLDAQAHIFDV